MALACAQKSSLTELAPVQWCKCCVTARTERPKRCNNFTRSRQHHYFLTHVIDERHQLVHSTSYLTVLVPLSSALFCICTRTTPGTFSISSTTNFNFTTFQQVRPDKGSTLSHPLPAKHGLLTERFSKPNVRFASATHACAVAYCTGADPGFSLGRGSRSKRRPQVQVAPLFRLRRPLAYGVAYRYLLR